METLRRTLVPPPESCWTFRATWPVQLFSRQLDLVLGSGPGFWQVSKVLPMSRSTHQDHSEVWCRCRRPAYTGWCSHILKQLNKNCLFLAELPSLYGSSNQNICFCVADHWRGWIKISGTFQNPHWFLWFSWFHWFNTSFVDRKEQKKKTRVADCCLAQSKFIIWPLNCFYFSFFLKKQKDDRTNLLFRLISSELTGFTG